MKFFYLIILTSFGFQNCGIGGKDVIPVEHFEKQRENYFIGRFASCNLNENLAEDQTGEEKVDPLLSLLAGVAEYWSSDLRSGLFVTEKDAKFCYLSLLASPCMETRAITLTNLSMVFFLHCNPKKVCFNERQHIGQGALCIEGP